MAILDLQGMETPVKNTEAGNISSLSALNCGASTVSTIACL